MRVDRACSRNLLTPSDAFLQMVIANKKQKTIDNLLKGAASQCLQNMNLARGYAEYEGIPLID
ncbi:hypothetical protein F4777DRAFT_572691 [Nemania sp. FL0916]|nr:hypothetical protein F4777DRAFT_572691 [Nemania sp. FL0916]